MLKGYDPSSLFWYYVKQKTNQFKLKCAEKQMKKKLEKALETEGTTTNWTLGEISHLSMHTRKGKAREDVCSRVSPYLLCSVVLQSLEKSRKNVSGKSSSF